MEAQSNIEVKSNPVALVEYVAKCLVKYPDDVQIIPVKGPSSLVIELRVNKEDLGSIIGKGGRIAKAIRVLLNSISDKKIETEEGISEKYTKVLLEIIDE
ncbi:MAG: KH domain-containing protein [Spirochaetia bacterium]|nr:KH domain-containing protein [Spirochaetia bacterium]